MTLKTPLQASKRLYTRYFIGLLRITVQAKRPFAEYKSVPVLLQKRPRYIKNYKEALIISFNNLLYISNRL
ncbi:hypothetical protein FB550_11764 [Neobacillus bataviensis]|uniref:Uncharacterized protein n=1 Tax=Neobacillus bataviensis TaxID=220685 RepID=A0A561CMN9_9BACI|nr:hypothetical protein FB550_11764 [Neobacillus bataviensis]